MRAYDLLKSVFKFREDEIKWEEQKANIKEATNQFNKSFIEDNAKYERTNKNDSVELGHFERAKLKNVIEERLREISILEISENKERAAKTNSFMKKRKKETNHRVQSTSVKNSISQQSSILPFVTDKTELDNQIKQRRLASIKVSKNVAAEEKKRREYLQRSLDEDERIGKELDLINERSNLIENYSESSK